MGGEQVALVVSRLQRRPVAQRGPRHALRQRTQKASYQAEGGAYLSLRGLEFEPLCEIDQPKIATLCRIVRSLAFAAVHSAQSGHPAWTISPAPASPARSTGSQDIAAV
jgi:hypothetical protein